MDSADYLRGAIKFSIGLLCAAAFVLILIILSGSDVDETSGRAIGTAVALAFLSLTAVAGSHLSIRRPQLLLLGYATVLVSGLAFLATTVAIWSGGDNDGWKPAAYLLVLAFACGHSSVLLAGGGEGDSDGIAAVRIGTLGALWLLVVMTIAEISSSGDSLDPQLLGVVAVLYALGTVVLPLLRRMTPPPPSQPQRQKDLPVDHVCFVWPGTADSAVIDLTNRGIQVVDGPVARTGAHGAGVSVYYRDPDGSLVELIAYR